MLADERQIAYNVNRKTKGEVDVMCRAIDAANFFVEVANSDPDDCMTNLRVNKLLFYAQGWHLVRFKKPLFQEDFEAWPLGPVVPDVYKAFKPCGRERIAAASGDFSPSVFTSEEIDLLLDVSNEYGKYSSPALVNMTHAKDSPWKKVYEPGANRVIPIRDMEAYFSGLEPLKTFVLPEVPEEDYIGYRNQDGILVLPKEYDA